MSVEDRLYALALQSRQQGGDAFLLTPGQFMPRLNSQAPDLHAEIRALAAAFETSAAARIAASANPEGDAAAIASEIAARERISMISATAAVVVARRIGPLNAAPAPHIAPTPAPAAGGWAGDSLAVGAAPQAPQAPAAPNYHPSAQTYAPPQPPPPGYYQQPPGAPAAPTEGQGDKMKSMAKNPLVMGALAIVIGVLVYQNFLRPQPQQTYQDQGQGGQGQGGQGQGGQGQGGQDQGGQGQGGGGMQGGQGGGNAQAPMLQAPGSGGPTLQVQRHQSGAPAFMFTMQTQQGAQTGMVMLPQGGWQSGPAGIGFSADGNNITTGGEGQFQLVQSGGHPVRLAQIQMQQDALNTGGLCLMFRGAQGAQDVQLSGADFCVMNSSCSQPLGCGKLQ